MSAIVAAIGKSGLGSTLISINTTFMPNGSKYFVNSVKDYFRLDLNSTAADDGYVIVRPTTGPGRWFRELIPAQEWNHQSTWYIDAINGHDENDGLTGAIKTLTELRRRWGNGVTINQDTIVNILTDLNSNDTPSFNPILNANLTILGTPKTPLTSGGILTVPNIDRVGKQPQEIVFSGNWSALVNKRIRITNGAAPNVGAVAYVAKDKGSGIARTSAFEVPSTFSKVSPQIGDSFLVEDLPKITLGQWTVLSGSSTGKSLTFDSVELDGNSGIRGTIQADSGIDVYILGCQCVGARIGGLSTSLSGCRADTVGVISGGQVGFFGCLVTTDAIRPFQYSTAILDQDTMAQGCPLLIPYQGGSGVIGTACAFDGNSTAGAVVILDNSSMYTVAFLDGTDLLWGDNNANDGLYISSGGTFSYTTKPIINAGLGVGREVRVGGVQKVWSDMPYINPINMAKVVVR